MVKIQDVQLPFLTADELTPAMITSSQNDYAPSGGDAAFCWRLSTDASRNLTGISIGQTAGRLLMLMNVGAQNLVLKHNVTSTAANRFDLPGAADLTLGQYEGVLLEYDGTLTRWVIISMSVPGSGGALTDHTHAATGSGSNGGGDTLSPATFTFPAATSPAQTAEGSAVWDSDDDKLTVGTGAGRKTLVNSDDSRLSDARTPILQGICNGRLTLTTAVPVTTSDVTAATTVYFTPFRGSQIATYSGSAWTVQSFSEQSISLSGLTANTNYDIFIVDSTLALEAVAWTNGTTRATAIVLQDGVYVKSGATTRRYLGTIRITGTTGQTEDSVAHRFVWNAYNRVGRQMAVNDATDTWTYGTASWRQARATATNQVDYVCGLAEDIVTAFVHGFEQASNTAEAEIGIGVDSTTAVSAQLIGKVYVATTSGGSRIPLISRYAGCPGLGYHYLAWLEYAGSGASVTFCGDDGSVAKSGIMAEVLA